MTLYHLFVAFVLAIPAAAVVFAVLDLFIGWLADGAPDHPGGTR